jgi:cytochrome c6
MQMRALALVLAYSACVGQGARTSIKSDISSQEKASEADQGSQSTDQVQQSSGDVQSAPPKRSSRWATLIAGLTAAATPAAGFGPGNKLSGPTAANALSQRAAANAANVPSAGRVQPIRLTANDQDGDSFEFKSPEAQLQDLNPKLQATVQDLAKSAATIGRLANDAQGASQAEAKELRRQLYAAALAVAVALGPPEAAIAADVEAGAQIFQGNCAACHAGGNNVIQAEKTLRKEALDQYLTGGRNEKAIQYQVTNGKNAMPAFGGRLAEDEIADVAAYVYDQATNEKWDE